MNTLLANANILDVKYGFYYMSSCLDHVLYDKTNLSGKQKRIEADSFNEKYREDVDAFIDFICNSDFSVQGSYEETWDYIKHGTNSLKRHTNLRLAIEEYKNDEKAE